MKVIGATEKPSVIEVKEHIAASLKQDSPLHHRVLMALVDQGRAVIIKGGEQA